MHPCRAAPYCAQVIPTSAFEITPTASEVLRSSTNLWLTPFRAVSTSIFAGGGSPGDDDGTSAPLPQDSP